MTRLHWLPSDPAWRARLKSLRSTPRPAAEAWAECIALARANIDFLQTNALDQVMQSLFAGGKPAGLGTKPVRLAMLGSCTMAHLHGAIRVAGARRGIWIDIYENDFGQYMQELADTASALHAFKPNAVLFALDAYNVVAGMADCIDPAEAEAMIAAKLDHIEACWTQVREAFNCPILHQTPLPVHATVLGLNEHRLPSSPAGTIAAVNRLLRVRADARKVDLLTVDDWAAKDGLSQWHDTGFWHHAKQEVVLAAAPIYGDLVARILAAHQGLSGKCLVLDLDNTLWGGVIGDDGMDGIVLGQGSVLGEAYTAFQGYARALSRRGIILAVCSKNDEANAVEPFEKHPEMTLRRPDIASFFANWIDKPTNIKAIAAELNIGLDSLVFVDDNPVERALVRQELPMVAVPEVSDDPITFVKAVADAGYFESIAITDEDRARTAQYQGNRARDALKASTTDLGSYLRDLEMELLWRPFDRIGLQRVVQLINKTNQFNLTTRRYGEDDVLAVMGSDTAFGLQLRLTDRFGDNGIIGICIVKIDAEQDAVIDTWLMSCRVLGRQVEQTTLNLIVDQAKSLGAKRLLGDYIPTKKNAMVKEHYTRLGFAPLEVNPDGSSRCSLDLAAYETPATFITVTEG